MANAYKLGDIVQLKSGGPPMTISKIVDMGRAYWCDWFKGASKEQASFPEEVLHAYVAPKKDV